MRQDLSPVSPPRNVICLTTTPHTAADSRSVRQRVSAFRDFGEIRFSFIPNYVPVIPIASISTRFLETIDRLRLKSHNPVLSHVKDSGGVLSICFRSQQRSETDWKHRLSYHLPRWPRLRQYQITMLHSRSRRIARSRISTKHIRN